MITERGVEITHRNVARLLPRDDAVFIVQDQNASVDMRSADAIRVAEQLARALSRHVEAFAQPGRCQDIGFWEHLGELPSKRGGCRRRRGDNGTRAGKRLSVPSVEQRIDQGRHQREVFNIPPAYFRQIAHRIK